MGRWLLLWGPVAALMIAIFYASAIPNLTEIPGGFSDKTAHFGAYGLLGALAFRATAGGRWRGLSWGAGATAWLVAVAYGAFDEFHQSFVPGRFPGADDWLADALGAAAAVLLLMLCRRLFVGREV